MRSLASQVDETMEGLVKGQRDAQLEVQQFVVEVSLDKEITSAGKIEQSSQHAFACISQMQLHSNTSTPYLSDRFRCFVTNAAISRVDTKLGDMAHKLTTSMQEQRTHFLSITAEAEEGFKGKTTEMDGLIALHHNQLSKTCAEMSGRMMEYNAEYDQRLRAGKSTRVSEASCKRDSWIKSGVHLHATHDKVHGHVLREIALLCGQLLQRAWPVLIDCVVVWTVVASTGELEHTTTTALKRLDEVRNPHPLPHPILT